MAQFPVLASEGPQRYKKYVHKKTRIQYLEEKSNFSRFYNTYITFRPTYPKTEHCSHDRICTCNGHGDKDVRGPWGKWGILNVGGEGGPGPPGGGRSEQLVPDSGDG
jgi:hypothetical protein